MSRAIFLVSIVALMLLAQVSQAQEVLPEDAVLAIKSANESIKAAESDGLPLQSARDELFSAEQSMERADFAVLLRKGVTGPLAEKARQALEGMDYEGFTYSDVIVHTKNAESIVKDAYALFDSIRALEIKLSSYMQVPEPDGADDIGTLLSSALFPTTEDKKQLVDTAGAEALLEEARAAFAEERFLDGSDLIIQAHRSLEASQAEITTVSIISAAGRGFFERYWAEIMIFSAIAAGVALLAWKTIWKKRLRKKIKRMKIEKGVLMELMKKAQEERFRKATLSESLYNIKMRKYQERFAVIKETLPSLESMLEGKKPKEKKPKKKRK